RLERQIKAALDNREASSEMVRRFDKLFSRLNGYFPVEKPSLIHGDLWSGNLIVDEKGDPCIIDPAVYYGHREMELSFTKLFGGYDKDFYNSYEEVFPLEPGFNDRIDLYNLYPLLVHVNLFGGGYINQVNLILKRFT
ncbi:MAG: fructosamine kinase family protein, partial [Cyclobacteriaceae bacterium]|nr:fructosamine kinase family protein [Cyclobacteriaceae bacterium]